MRSASCAGIAWFRCDGLAGSLSAATWGTPTDGSFPVPSACRSRNAAELRQQAVLRWPKGVIPPAFGGFSYNLSINPGSLRAKPLVIKVTYPAGSTVQITLPADFSSWSELAITEDNGVEISVEDPNDPSGISPLIPS